MTCSPLFAPGFDAFQVSGWPDHCSVDGIRNVPSGLNVVLDSAQSTHLSRTVLACAFPVCWYSSATRSMDHAWKPNHWLDGGSWYTGFSS